MELIDKAQAILDNKNFSDRMIAKKIGSTRVTINKYSRGVIKLSDTKYSTVKALADEYDKDEIAMIDMANTGAFKYFTARMQGFFNEIKEDQLESYDSDEAFLDDKALIYVLDDVNKAVVNDSSLMIDLYKTYYKRLNEEMDNDS